jgi:hypothetical protein
LRKKKEKKEKRTKESVTPLRERNKGKFIFSVLISDLSFSLRRLVPL